MSNPFRKSLEPLRGKRVRVVSNDGRVRVGYLERVHYQDRHVVLRDAHDPTAGERLGRSFVSHVDTIDTLDETDEIRVVDVAAVRPSPYHVREFDAAENISYINQVRERGYVGSWPVVRETADGLELLAGHKRLWVCRQADLDEHPVRVVDVDDWDAARRFVFDHFPQYSDGQIEQSLEELIDDWGTERVFDLPLVEAHLDRLDRDGTDNSPETRCGDTDDEAAAESASDANDGSEAGIAADQDTTTDDADVGGDTNHDIDCEELTPSQREVVDALSEHGELTSSEVDTITGRSYKHLSNLEERDIVESRKDPDDERRYLYSLSAEEAEHADGPHDESDDSGEHPDEGHTEEIDTAATNGDLTVADIDWLDESSFHVAVAESTGLQQLRDTLGWLDEDGDLAALVRGMDATEDLPDFQEAGT